MNPKQLNILLAALVIVLAGALVYFIFGNKAVAPEVANTPVTNSNSQTISNTNSETEIDTSSKRNTYTNSTLGFSVELPEGWVAKETADGIQFASKASLAEGEQNSANCKAGKQCNSQFMPTAVYLSNESMIANEGASNPIVKTYNGVKFATYTVDGLVTSYFYETDRNQRSYVFSTNTAKNYIEGILNTLKFTK